MHGILLCNLGTPDEPTTQSVRRYLGEFLWDPRVVEIPRPLWWCILHGIILRTRPKKSAAAYQKIWQAEGSPLRHHTEILAKKLQARLNDDNICVLPAMRYGNPSIKDSLLKMRAKGVTRLTILPLFPQYSAVTTASIFDKVSAAFKHCRHIPEIHTINDYHDQPLYIKAIADSIQTHWQQQPRAEKLLFSFHGLPQRNVDKGEPYYRQCMQSARLIAETLKLKQNEWEVVFQSRFGAAKWLQPYCVERLQALPKEGVTTADVICPGFACDCLETLEEIAIQNKEIYIESGGKILNYIPALGSSDAQVNIMSQLLERSIALT